MRYQWDFNELFTNYDLLQKMYEKFDDENVRANIMLSMALYQNMARMVNKNGNGVKIFDDGYDENDIDNMINELNNAYSDCAIEYLYPLLNSFFIVKDYKYNTKEVYQRIEENNDALIYLTEDFFNKMTIPKIAKDFKNILDQKNKIQIRYDNATSNYAGLTLIDDVLHEKYIYISRKNILLDLTLLPHEAFHYIFINEYIGINYSYNTKYLIEVEGMLANMLFGEYYKDITEKHDNIFVDYNNRLYQEHIEDLVVKQSVLQALNEKKKIRFNKLNKFLNKVKANTNEFVDKNGLVSYLELPQDIGITYTLSNLIAIDLYYKYLEDREKAFYLLKRIKDVEPTDQVLNLLEKNEITFMNDDYTNLKKYLKKKD